MRGRTKQLLAEMALQELRQALLLTQQELAGSLGINQAAVSKIERQSDMYVSTLRRFLEAMGADLKIVYAAFNGSGRRGGGDRLLCRGRDRDGPDLAGVAALPGAERAGPPGISRGYLQPVSSLWRLG